MYHTWFRLGGASLCGAGAAMAFAQGNTRAGVFLGLLAALFVFGYLRYGEIGPAWRADGRGEREKALRLLNATPFRGRLLVSNHRASYHLLRARLLLKEYRVDEAIAECERALSIRTTPHNRAMAHALRAACHIDREEIDGAEAELAKARALRPKPSLAPSLQRIEEGIEQLRADQGDDAGDTTA